MLVIGGRSAGATGTGLFANINPSNGSVISSFNLPAGYLVKNIQIDANFGVNFKNTPSILVGGIGISWRFDENYTEILLRAPKEKTKSDKKGKSNDKSKKRLDEVPAPK
jgi:hypothetical protein